MGKDVAVLHVQNWQLVTTVRKADSVLRATS